MLQGNHAPRAPLPLPAPRPATTPRHHTPPPRPATTPLLHHSRFAALGFPSPLDRHATHNAWRTDAAKLSPFDSALAHPRGKPFTICICAGVYAFFTCGRTAPEDPCQFAGHHDSGPPSPFNSVLTHPRGKSFIICTYAGVYAFLWSAYLGRAGLLPAGTPVRLPHFTPAWFQTCTRRRAWSSGGWDFRGRSRFFRAAAGRTHQCCAG